jgi:hypothetical protein
MGKNDPTEIQYCLKSGAILHKMPFPVGCKTSYLDCEDLAKRLLNTYWRVEGGTLSPMHKASKSNPLPDLVRIIADNDSVFCQWSIDEMLNAGLARG